MLRGCVHRAGDNTVSWQVIFDGSAAGDEEEFPEEDEDEVDDDDEH